MLIVMQAHATEAEVRDVCQKIESLGYRAHSIPGAMRTAIGITGNQGEIEAGWLEEMSGVAEVIRVTKPYKLVSRDIKEDNTVIRFPGAAYNRVNRGASAGRAPAEQEGEAAKRCGALEEKEATVGGRELAIMAGPCAIENPEQAFAVGEQVYRAGARFFRGGAYKPRTSPYSFQGLGVEGLKIMAEVRRQFGLKIVTEAIDNESLDLVEEYADIIQIGARNMQNFSLLKRAGRAKRPVLLKRGMAATLEEFLMAAEYIMSEGNYQVILCERGVRTFADHTRNTLDLSVVPAVQRLSHLPIVVDPSHGTGKRNKVTPLSRAAVAVGADGLLIEVHNNPDRALSDGPQSLLPEQFAILMEEIRQIARVVHREAPPARTEKPEGAAASAR
jgi:3-deoxy-7-phosphoheptulonate synthase